MNVEHTDFVSVVTRMASFKDPDGNALLLHRRFDA